MVDQTNIHAINSPAVLGSGRLDRKIEQLLPNVETRASNMLIHSCKMNVYKDGVSLEEIVRGTVNFNGGKLKVLKLTWEI